MDRRSWILVLLVALAGCGQSSYSTPSERGASHLRSGNYDEAITTLSQAIEQNPRDVEARLNRGKAYQYRNHTGDLDRAIEDFTEVIGLAPGDPDAYYNRSMAYRDRGHEGDETLSSQDNDAAHERDPRFSEVYQQIPTQPMNVRITPPPAEDVASDGQAAPEAGAESSGGEAASNIDELFDRRQRTRQQEFTPPKQAEVQSPDPQRRDDQEEMRRLYQRARQAARDASEGGSAFISDPSSRGRDGGAAGDSAPLSPLPDRQPLRRRGEGSPTNRDRFSSGPDFPTIPASPRQRNPYSPGAAGGALPNQSSVSRGPRPTGYVDEPQLPPGTFRPQPRSLYDRSSALPSVRDPRPTGPNPDDFNGP